MPSHKRKHVDVDDEEEDEEDPPLSAVFAGFDQEAFMADDPHDENDDIDDDVIETRNVPYIMSMLERDYPQLRDRYASDFIPVWERWSQPAGGDNPQNATLYRLFKLARIMTESDQVAAQQYEDTKQVMQLIDEDTERIRSVMREWQEHGVAWVDKTLASARQTAILEHRRLLAVLYHTRMFVFSLTMAMNNSLENGFHQIDGMHGSNFFNTVHGFQPLIESDVKDPRTTLVVYLLTQFQQRRWKKKEESEYIYEEVVYKHPDTGATIMTYCYHATDSIEKAVYRLIDKDERGDLFKAITNSHVVRDVVTFLRNGKFQEFPFLQIEPVKYSFLDGVWDAETDTFAYYDQIEVAFPELCHGSVTYKFLRVDFAPVYYADIGPPPTPGHGTPYYERPEQGAEAFSMSDIEEDDMVQPSPMRTHPEWSDDTSTAEPTLKERLTPAGKRIISPHEIVNTKFEKIFHDQKWSEDCIKLKYATLGRTLFPSGTFDKCQYISVDIGDTATGKSTVLSVYQEIAFNFWDVFVFVKNENLFGLDKLATSRIFVAPDMRGEDCIPPSVFLIFAARDSMIFPRKFREPLFVSSVTTPGLIATNELPSSYRNDVRGSLARRILPFGYTEEVHTRDPNLKHDILKRESAGILRKSVGMYMDDDIHPKEEDIMNNKKLPPQIVHERRKLERASNALIDFLMSDQIKLDDAADTHVDMFRDAFQQYCRNVRQQKPPAWTSVNVEFGFKMFGLAIETVDEELYVRRCRLVNHQPSE